jgi:hypothetical protein
MALLKTAPRRFWPNRRRRVREGAEYAERFIRGLGDPPPEDVARPPRGNI